MPAAALQGRSNAAFDLGAGLLFLTGLRRRMIALAGPIFVVGRVVTKLAINEQKHTDRADEPVLSH